MPYYKVQKKMIDCNAITVVELKKHKYYKSIDGRSSMKKAELCKALNKIIVKKSKGAKKDITPKTPKKPKSPKKAESPVRSKTPSKKTPVKSIISRSEPLPFELYRTIMLEMSPDDMLNACSTTKAAVKLCNDDNFWKDYYGKRKIDFVPRTYDYKSRISTAKQNVMLSMSIEDLEKECLNNRKSKSICESLQFWKSYYQSRGFDFPNNNTISASVSRLFKDLKLKTLMEKNKNKKIWLRGKIYDIAKFVNFIEESFDNRYKYFAFRDAVAKDDHKYITITIAHSQNGPYRLYKARLAYGHTKAAMDFGWVRILNIYDYIKQ